MVSESSLARVTRGVGKKKDRSISGNLGAAIGRSVGLAQEAGF